MENESFDSLWIDLESLEEISLWIPTTTNTETSSVSVGDVPSTLSRDVPGTEELGHNVPFIDPYLTDASSTSSCSTWSSQSSIDPFEPESPVFDYSIDQCIPLTTDVLRRFCWENRFYFVSTFLLQEGYLSSLANCTEITREKLSIYYNDIKRRYSKNNGVFIYPDCDEAGNTSSAYLSALDSSFKYPLALFTERSLKKYWEIALRFHSGTDGYSVESMLVNNRPKLLR